MSYVEAHKYFLQAMMQEGIASKSQCTTLMKKCCELTEDRSEWDLYSFITCLNKQIQQFHLEIRKGTNEDDGKEMFALISITDHEINHLAVGGDLTKVEIEVFRRTIDLIVGSTTGMVSSTEVLNLTNDLQQKNISKSDAEALIAKLVKQRWLGEKDGIVFLTARTILELEPYIKSELRDCLIFCGVCRNMVFRGVSCPKCCGKIHNYCASTYFRGRSDLECKCPSCHEIMSTSSLDIDQTSNGTLNGSIDRPTTTSERRKRRR